jgi:Fe-S cluster assembly protein SufD
MASFATAVLPSPEEEIWRYSRIDELDLGRFELGTVEARVTNWKSSIAQSAAAEPPVDVFTELNRDNSEAVVLLIPAGVVVAEPIEVSWTRPDDGSVTFPRLVVEAGEGSEVTVVERFGSDDVSAVVVPVTELHAGPSARLRYVSVNRLGRRVWQLAHQIARGGRESTSLLATVALGGYYARVRSDARLDGVGASGEQIAAYFGGGDQMHDFRTLQDHAAPKTTSNLLFKGAVQGRARSVYTGLIRVRKEAPGTNAFQTNRNLKLSEEAWADSVPNLEIENNDVRCSHASAVGPIDPDQRFYLESRGVRPETAERLIVLGFFDEVLERLPDPIVAAELRAAIAEKLDEGGVVL